jgi:TnpA family transposase
MSTLSILTTSEQQAFDYPPPMPSEIQTVCFSINNLLEKEINALRTPANKVGFLLQYAYFKACKRFFIMSRFTPEPINHAAKLLGIAADEVDLSSYKKKMPIEHQKKILKLLEYKPFDDKVYAWLKKEALRLTEQQIEPRQIFIHLIDLLQHNKIEVPSYHRLAEMITLTYAAFENGLLIRLRQNIKVEDKKCLDALLNENESIVHTAINELKTINQSVKPKSIQASMAQFKKVKAYFLKLKPAIDGLNLSPNSSAYYATWVQKAKLSQLKQFPDKDKLYLHLLAFIQHQFYLRQDYFVDVVLKCVQSIKSTASKKLKESDQLTRTERRKAVRYLSKSHHQHQELIDEINHVAKSTLFTDSTKIDKINVLLDAHKIQQSETEKQKIALYEKSLDSIVKNEDYFDLLEKMSVKLQHRITQIITALIFNETSSDKNLLVAIEHFREKEGHITQQAPTDFMSKENQEGLWNKDKKFRISLYKIVLFITITDAIKSGTLNLNYSYRYKAIHDYLIDEHTWKEHRDQLIQSAGLEDLANYQKTMGKLKQYLDEKYQRINQSFIEKRNPYLSIDDKGIVHVTTPAIEEKDKEYTAALFEQTGYVPILHVLSQVEKVVSFTPCFKHHSIKHVKQRPGTEIYFGGLIGLGCNIGVRKMAQISLGIKENTLLNAVNWYFSLKNLQAANQRIVALINKLVLPSIFIHDKEKIHSASDGRKVNVGVESLIANYSFKYFGKDKGVSVYTFIDERQALFHSLVMSSSEREAAYVIDGLIQNEVTKTSIHSTDTHGFTETLFATTYFLEVAFAPRIKKIGKQRIYAFSARKTYEKRGYKILPSRSISQELIATHWDDIVRFMVTIKLKVSTASQLFKRLSSYAKENPLYQALKEFGRVIKSIFILTYFDDVKLRQRIEKQLNRIELSNKFSNAIFFANNREFSQATREEQEIATACKVLIQNAIVLWNYLYLSQLLTNCRDDNERNDMVSMIKNCSVIIWRHINLHGEYDFKRQAANDYPFDMDKILSLQVA